MTFYASLPSSGKSSQFFRWPHTRRMRCSLIPSFALIFIFTYKPVLGKPAIVGGNFTLTASENCSDSDGFKLTTADNTVTVARQVNAAWKAETKRFIGRIVHDSPSTLILTDLNYKDTGYFEFFCGKKLLKSIDLKVLVPHIKNVTEGDTVELDCYSRTADQVKWIKEGGEIRDREVFSKEVFYKEDEASPGRFLLSLGKVRPEDQGVYFCDASMAFKLIVNQRKPDQTTSTPSTHYSTTQSPNELNKMRPSEIFSWVLVVVLCFFVIVLAIFYSREKKKGRRLNERNGNEERAEMGVQNPNNLTNSHDSNHND